MTDDGKTKKALAGLGQMMEKAAAAHEAAARQADANRISGSTAAGRGYDISFRKKSAN